MSITEIAFIFPLVQLSLPADLVNFNFCHEKLLTTQVDEAAVLRHLSRLVEDMRLFQVTYLHFVNGDDDYDDRLIKINS